MADTTYTPILLCVCILLALVWIGYRAERQSMQRDLRDALRARPSDAEALLAALAAETRHLSAATRDLQAAAQRPSCAVREAAEATRRKLAEPLPGTQAKPAPRKRGR